MLRSLKFGLAVSLASLAALTLVRTEPASAREQAGTAQLALPLRLSAWAVNLDRSRNNVIEINITRWTTPAERTALLNTMVENDTASLLKSLVKLPDHGLMRIPGWQGADPHKVLLGWKLHYAWNAPDGDGGQRIVLATDRYMSFLEVQNDPRSTQYPFTLVDIRLNKNGEGEGKASVATKITFDKKKNVLELENYGTEPVRLQQVRIEK